MGRRDWKRTQTRRRGGGGGDLVYPWYLASLSISYGGKPQTYKKEATNEWTFSMPPGDVIISAAFSQTPVKSSELAVLDVSVSAAVTPKLLSGQYTYTADIPHIIPTAVSSEEEVDEGGDGDSSEVQTFSIIAIPEDPQAEVTITQAGGTAPLNGAEYELIEGATVYTITVESDDEKLPINAYTFTVSYWPELALSSIELSSSGNDGWTHKIPVQDEQDVLLPYESLTITAALPEENGVAVSANKTGDGTMNAGNGTWTLTYDNNTAAFSSVVTITSSKQLANTEYKKEYILKITKPAAEEASKIPTTFWAASDGGGRAIILDGDTYYEAHTFLSSGTLSISAVPDSAGSLSAQVLVVAGGGGGGGASWPSSGGGAGGMVEANNHELNKQDYPVLVGLGGAGGYANKQSVGQGSNGGDSSFGGITAKGGGGGGGHNQDNVGNGEPGGSSGGGKTSPAVSAAELPENAQSFGNIGGADSASDVKSNTAGGGGGAGGPGSWADLGNSGGVENHAGGNGRENSINGTAVIYAAGGNVPFKSQTNKHGEANTGNGGGGAWNKSGGNGGSGIVIVRFPARPNEQ